MNINLVMIVKDEERSLKRCLTCARPLVDQMLVLDTGSTDKTKEIARGLGALVWDYTWCNDFSAARNAALERSEADWNLVLDADEYLLPCSREELERQIRAGEKEYGKSWAGSMLRLDSFIEDGRQEISYSWLPRLLPRGTRYAGLIHEQPEISGPLLCLPLKAEHDGYLQEDKGRRNLEYLRRAAEEHPEDSYYQFQLGMTLRNLKRPQESLPYFDRFYQRGERQTGYWVQGVVLYLYALLDAGEMSCLKTAQAVVEAETPYLGGYADFRFVCGLFYMRLVLSDTRANLAYLPRIEESFQECLRIGERPEQGGVAGSGSFKAAYNLGVWYEVSGQMEQAARFYRESAAAGFEPAVGRLRELGL